MAVEKLKFYRLNKSPLSSILIMTVPEKQIGKVPSRTMPQQGSQKTAQGPMKLEV